MTEDEAERHQRLTELFSYAAALVPQDRDAFLRALRGDDRQLRPALEELLACDDGEADDAPPPDLR